MTSSADSSAQISAASMPLPPPATPSAAQTARWELSPAPMHVRQLRPRIGAWLQLPVGTITNSFATGSASGGAGSTVDPFIASVDPTRRRKPAGVSLDDRRLRRSHLRFVIALCSSPSPLPASLPPSDTGDVRLDCRRFTRPADLARGATGASHSEPHGQYSARGARYPARGQQCPRRDQDPATASAATALQRRRRRRQVLPSLPSAGSWIFRRPPKPA